MSTALCLVISILVSGLGGIAMWVGFTKDDGGMQAKLGGSVITVVGVVGVIACLATA